MDISTATAILLNQINQYSAILSTMTMLANQANNIASNEASITDPAAVIKGIVASIDVQLTGSESQQVLVRRALDDLSTILG